MIINSTKIINVEILQKGFFIITRKYSSIPIQASCLIGTSSTLRDIKGEMLLTFVAELFDDYVKLHNGSCNKEGVISLTTNSDDDNYIANEINALISYFNDNVTSKEKLLSIFLKGGMFIPEYFGMLLIYLYKVEFKRSFRGFPYIDTFDMSSLLSIYEKVNISLKKEYLQNNPTKRLWEHRTVIDTMDKVASLLLKEYLQFQYKVNIMRKSKQRKRSK